MALKVARNRWYQGILLVALVPLAVAAVCLARVPGHGQSFKVSDDGMFVLTGYHTPVEDEATTYGLMSLDTGELKYLRACNAPNFSHGSLYWCEDHARGFRAKRLDLNTFRETDLAFVDANPFERYYSLFHPGFVATVNKLNEICVIDLKTGALAVSALPPLRSSKFHAWFPEWDESSQRLLVRESSNGATMGRERVVLFSYTDGVLTQLTQWTATRDPIVDDGQIVSITIDHDLEIRRASDGVLTESQPLGTKLGLPVPASARPLSVWISDVKSRLIRLSVRNGSDILYDYSSQQIVWQRTGPRGWCQELRENIALYVSDNEIELVRLDQHTPPRRIKFPAPVRDAILTHGGQRVCILLRDDSVHVYDTATDDRLRSYREKTWVVPTFAGLFVGFFVWSALWVRQSLRIGTAPLGDVVLLNGLVLAGLVLRVFLQGSQRDAGRPIFWALQAVSAGWLFSLVFWFVFGKARWSLKVVALCLAFVGGLLISMFVYRGNQRAIMELLIGGLGVTLMMSVIVGFARRWGWRLINVHSWLDSRSATIAEHRIPLRDTFFLIAAIGAFCAAARNLPSISFNIEGAGILALLVLTTSFAALGAAWAALSPRHWLTRFVVLGLLLAIAGSIHSLVFPQFYHWFAWMWHLRFAAFVTISSCASLWIFRLRGWRFERPKNISAEIP